MTRLLLGALRILVLMGGLVSAAQAQTITVYSSGNVTVGTTRQLTAYVPLAPNGVAWSVNGVIGGNATYGTVGATGLYSAPSVIPAANVVAVRATSTTYPDKAGTAMMTITQLQPRLWNASPASVPLGAFTLMLNGASFGSNAVARFGGVPLMTTRVSDTRLVATGLALSSQVGLRVAVDVQATGLGGINSDVVQVRVSSETPPPLPISITLSPAAVTLAPRATQAFSATVSGASNTAVTWAVGGINGGNATLGTISAAGLYTAPTVPPAPPSVTVRATSVASASAYASATVALSAVPNPGPGGGTPDLAAARFLEQAGFGPTPADLARLKLIGQAAWLNEQFAMPETAIANPGSLGNGVVQSQYVSRLTLAPDQLRQRVAYALAQVFVISMNKNNYPEEVVPHLQTLSRNAFGNYRTLLGELATSPQMGKYLDLANSNKPAPGSGANENLARELLQLFTIGLVRLNADGTPMLDSLGVPLPTYDQVAVQQLALAFTGWTYAGPGNNNWENFSGPMQPRDVNHDMRAKSLLGCSLAANQTTRQDMDAALDCVFKHPNVGPFVALRLIRQLVTSNPTPAYVQRVAAVFDNNGGGVRGDLRAVVRAIITDGEARNDGAAANGGRLKDPLQHLASLLRALGGSIPAGNVLSWEFSRLGEAPLTPPSVFGFYAALFRVPQTTLAGPEFQIYTPTEAVLRGNLIWRALTNPGGDFTLSLAPYMAVAGSTPTLIDKVDQTLLWGRMPTAMRQSLGTAIDAQPDAQQRALTALYLTVLSGLHAVQY